MAKICFSGIFKGPNVSLSATQGGTTSGPLTISAWKTPMMDNEWSGALQNQTLTVSVDEVIPAGRRFAPIGIEYRISVTGSTVGDTPDLSTDVGFGTFDPTYQGIHYVLHTGDAGNYRNERVGHASHRDKAFQYGQNPGHVYSSPGTYQRSVYVYDDQGAWGTLTLDPLVVEDPDVVFPAERTIVVSNNGDFTGAPHHENPDDPGYNELNRVESITAAAARFQEIKGIGTSPDGGIRVAVKSGQEFYEAVPNDTFFVPGVSDEDLKTFITKFTRGRHCFNIFGGNAPILYSERNSGVQTQGGLFAPHPDGGWPWAIQDWKFDFGYDVNAGMPSNGWDNYNGRGLSNVGDDSRFTAAAGGLRLVHDRVEVEGCMSAVIGVANPAFVDRMSGWFFNDCVFQRNNEYLVFQASNLFFLGTQVLETYGTELGLMGRSRVGGAQRGFRGHRNIRETTNWMIYIRACFFESRGGWSGQNGGTTLYAPQPLMRLHEASSSAFRVGKRLYFCDSVFLGPFGAEPTREEGNGVHQVVENSLIFFDPATSIGKYAINGLSGRKTIRNCQLVCLNTPKMGGSSDPATAAKNHAKFETNTGNQNIGRFERFLFVEDMNNTYDEPLELIHNTYVMLRPTSGVSGTYEVMTPGVMRDNNSLGAVGTIYDLVDGHNVNYAPQLSIGPQMDMLDLPAGVRVLDVWMKMVWELVSDYALPNPIAPGQTTLLIPYPYDWNNVQTGRADYAGTGNNHSVRTESNGRSFAQLPVSLGNGVPYALDAITINLLADGFTVTNRHPTDTWTGDISIVLHRGSTAMEPDLLHEVDQSGVKLYRPTSPQALTDGVPTTLFDFTRKLRPDTGFAISPTEGGNAAGALLPA